ncbi:L,D-transpeptidase family protein [Parablastomonas sp. CN1-191]|uniref:L,D-transpeptidase family protein n=1 Tax=Parablastomonas sp. CN1-191 TaxID=3400908 RepID=UPI003BF872E5
MSARGRPLRLPIVLAAALLSLPGITAAQVPEPVWDGAAASRLLAYAEEVGSQGLVPATYGAAALRAAIDSGTVPALDAAANRVFAALARDLQGGHVSPGQRRQASFPSSDLSDDDITALRTRAIASGNVAAVLDGLAPQTPDYALLRRSLAELPSSASDQRDKIAASLERLRWLPRRLGSTYVWVNIAAYRALIVRDGETVADHRIIVGKPSTPTRQFAATITGVILNPSWQVPQSIIAESVGQMVRSAPGRARAQGYSWTRTGGQLRVVQAPGPRNALGAMKLDMANPFEIYIHDTPDKALFGNSARRFSHGCIRTDRPLEFAAILLKGETSPAEAARGGTTVRLPITQPVPVYVVYLTASADPAGEVVYSDDFYGLDRGLNAALARPRP